MEVSTKENIVRVLRGSTMTLRPANSNLLQCEEGFLGFKKFNVQCPKQFCLQVFWRKERVVLKRTYKGFLWNWSLLRNFDRSSRTFLLKKFCQVIGFIKLKQFTYTVFSSFKYASILMSAYSKEKCYLLYGLIQLKTNYLQGYALCVTHSICPLSIHSTKGF